MTFKHNIFGLNVEAEFDMKGPLAEFEVPDVIVKYGTVPEVLVEAVASNKHSQITKDKVLKQYDGIARFLVENGNSIIVDPSDLSTEDAVNLFLNGVVFGSLLVQRGLIPLHGSALELNGKCILVIGRSGAGKSSLATGLLERGARLITDDVIALREVDGSVLAYPAFPEQKVSADLLKHFDIESLVKGRVLYHNVQHEKYYINRENQFYDRPLKLDSIFFVQKTKNKFKLIEHKGVGKLDVVLRNIFSRSNVRIAEKQLDRYNLCTTIAKHTNIYTIQRRFDTFSVREQVEMVFKCLDGEEYGN